MSEVEETIKRLSSHKGVEGVVIVNMEGIPIRTTLDAEKTVQHAALITQLTAKARSVVRDLDPQNDLTFLRIRSKRHEIMVAPDKDYILIPSYHYQHGNRPHRSYQGYSHPAHGISFSLLDLSSQQIMTTDQSQLV
ncbi:hypothetical protein SeMB42_g00127 [Synchytrium endobioticum]|uniref:Roadblock/LAMTOR2 domain-containing protein n=1 Tax=Synchytrium endobioticum TaxID=286115 RepID=A0A507DUJ8_9FUNG|nr:hypothetical protein SeMB42_g00127 [Synchytrium endobioticum]